MKIKNARTVTIRQGGGELIINGRYDCCFFKMSGQLDRMALVDFLCDYIGSLVLLLLRENRLQIR